MNSTKVQGKVVLCLRGINSRVQKSSAFHFAARVLSEIIVWASVKNALAPFHY